MKVALPSKTANLHCSNVVNLLPCDQPDGEMFMEEYLGCFVKVLNSELQVFQFETPEHLLLGIGRATSTDAYRETLYSLLGFIEKEEVRLTIILWLDSIFRKYNFDKPPLLVSINGVTKLTRNYKGFWCLTFPDNVENYQKGYGNPYLFVQKHKSSLKQWYGERFNDFVESKFNELYGEE